MLFDAHTRAFTALGGVAKRGIYDNMKTAVDKVSKGKRWVSPAFRITADEYASTPPWIWPICWNRRRRRVNRASWRSA